jgi:hypothetical protein
VQSPFLLWKLATFRQLKEISYSSEGEALYADPANGQIDAAMAVPGGFQAETG